MSTNTYKSDDSPREGHDFDDIEVEKIDLSRHADICECTASPAEQEWCDDGGGCACLGKGLPTILDNTQLISGNARIVAAAKALVAWRERDDPYQDEYPKLYAALEKAVADATAS